MTKRILALLLAVCMLAGVMAGCNKTNADPSKPDSSDSNNGGGTQKPDSQTSDATKQTSAKYVYTTDYVNLTLELAEEPQLPQHALRVRELPLCHGGHLQGRPRRHRGRR
mgnify:CR=1 FL=1